MSIFLAEFGPAVDPRSVALRAATFWNALAALPPGSLYKQMALAGPLVCPSQLGVQGMICVTGRMTWITLTSRSCFPTSGSAGMLFGIIWIFALESDLLKTHACAHTRTGLLGLQVAMLGHFWICPFHALHAALTALQDGLPQAAPGHCMLASCAKTKQILYIVPAGCLRR